jgi:hypothetical protein
MGEYLKRALANFEGLNSIVYEDMDEVNCGRD